MAAIPAGAGPRAPGGNGDRLDGQARAAPRVAATAAHARPPAGAGGIGRAHAAPGAGRERGPAPGAARVSIVVPVYNTRPYLRDCIESALAQTHPDTEIVAVDDGSTDGSAELLAEYGGAVRVVSLRHGGISRALNAGIRAMTGEWLKLLGSDDILLPGAVAELAAAAEGEASALGASPARFVPYMDTEEITEDGRPLSGPYPSPSGPLTGMQQGAMMLDVPYGLSASSLIHRSAFDAVGMFDERYGIGEDVELNLRLTMRGGYRMLHVPKTLYRYRRRGGQTTAGWLGVARHLRRVSADFLAGMDPGEREAYMREYKRFLRAKLFLYGAWAYANRGRRAAQGAPAGPGGGPTGGIAGSIGRHWLARLAYNAAKARSIRPCVRGWAYAAKNPRSELVARCRGRPINACTNIMRLGFAPPGEGGLDASGLPRLVVPWEAE